MNKFLRLLSLFVLALPAMQAHVGSPDIYLDSQAGPYRLFITVRPPAVIPGVAQVEIRTADPRVRELHAVPLPMSGPGAKFAPIADALQRSKEDPQFFTGSLWMMAPGSWQVRVTATGEAGRGMVAVPVPSAALTTKRMQWGLALVLLVLGSFLVFGIVAMAGASVREAKLSPGAAPGEAARRSGRRAMIVAAVAVLGALWLANRWWNSEAASYGASVYKPLLVNASLQGDVLTLRLGDPGWLDAKHGAFTALPVVRSVDDLVLDHEHLMHLYLIREPGLDRVYHLHPEQVSAGVFRLALPNVAAGDYKLYGDIVHASGFPETVVTSVQLPEIRGRALSGDDASGTAPAVSAKPLGDVFELPDGYRMEWLHQPGRLAARQLQVFRFRLLDAQGRPPGDMKLYMGMLGHAAFVKTDGTTFAHVHPTGSVPMASLMKAEMSNGGAMDMKQEPESAALPDTVGFPYGLPSAGRYRIFVQMKHGAVVETGAFDVVAD